MVPRSMRRGLIVGRDRPEAVGQERHQVTEHVQRTRQAVQEQDHRGILRDRLAAEDADAIDARGATMNGWVGALGRNYRRWRGLGGAEGCLPDYAGGRVVVRSCVRSP